MEYGGWNMVRIHIGLCLHIAGKNSNNRKIGKSELLPTKLRSRFMVDYGNVSVSMCMWIYWKIHRVCRVQYARYRTEKIKMKTGKLCPLLYCYISQFLFMSPWIKCFTISSLWRINIIHHYRNIIPMSTWSYSHNNKKSTSKNYFLCLRIVRHCSILPPKCAIVYGIIIAIAKIQFKIYAAQSN